MGTIKEEAQEYQPQQIKNISELSNIDINSVVFEDTEAEFPYKYMEINGERYKMPVSVLANLKAVLEENPNLKNFKVKKTGEGLKTTYTVIPLA